MSERIPAIILNANQRRHFEVLFARLEDSLTRVERLLAPLTDPRHALSIDEQEIPDDFRERASPAIHLLRERVVAATLSGEAMASALEHSSHSTQRR